MVVVFTNGCFDLIHAAHVDFLGRARALGDRLVVGLNSDASVRAIRGPGRPLVPQEDRRRVLAALGSVDEVVIFDEPTPARIIDELRPDVLVKGGDWSVDQIVGADSVRRRGGRVVSLPLVPGYSTTSLIDRIRGAADARGARAVDVDDDALTSALRDHLEVTSALLGECVPAIRRAGKRIAGALRAGSRLFVFGDGESSVDAQHIASSIARRVERPESVVGSRAGGGDLAGVPRAGDVAVALSTGGDPRGVLATVMTARERGCVTIGLTGAAGKRLASLCDVAVLVPSDHVPRIREAHVVIGHLWSELLRA